MTLLRRPASPAHPWPGEAQPAEAGFVRQNLFYFGASVVVLALAASYQFLTGRLLGPRDYAAVAAIFSLFSVLLVPGLIVTLVASRYAAAFAASGQADQLRFFFRRFSLLLLGISALGALVFLVASPLLAAFLNVPIGTVVSLAPAVLLILPAFFNRGVLQGLGLRPVQRAALGPRATAAAWALRVFVVVVSAMVIYTFIDQLH